MGFTDEEIAQILLGDAEDQGETNEEGAVVLDEELNYYMFNEANPPPPSERFPFQTNYNGYRLNLGHLRSFTPIQLIDFMWKDCMHHMVQCYNKRITHQLLDIRKLTLGRLYTWYGLRMYMTLFKRNSCIEHFRDCRIGDKLPALPNLSVYMSYEDFKEISGNITFEDYSTKTVEDKQDKAWKIRTIFELFKQKCRLGMPCPGEYISIDEAMMKYFGRRCPISMSMPQKPIKRGFLFYCAVDYETKWVFDINLADGGYDRQDFCEVRWGKSGQRVLDLVNHIPGHWHTIATDNLYSSEALAVELLHRNQYFIGTLRRNRLPRGRPQEIVNTKKHPKPSRACPKGTMSAAVNSLHTISLYSFMDSGLVYLLDTKFYPTQKSNILRKIGSETTELNVYEGIATYNSKMGGVDAWDALRTGFIMQLKIMEERRDGLLDLLMVYLQWHLLRLGWLIDGITLTKPILVERIFTARYVVIFWTIVGIISIYKCKLVNKRPLLFRPRLESITPLV